MTQQAANFWKGAQRVHQPVVCFCGFSSMWYLNSRRHSLPSASKTSDAPMMCSCQCALALDSWVLG